ncbi:MAG: ABC transporter substrate-binding protein, partial [bacterium]|nr:ABC transporter substrate-binding protein [bacterium]
ADGSSGGGAGNLYDDPRGGIFTEFQRGFDRGHPFGSLDAFCLPHAEPAEPRRAGDAGIGADTVTFAHMRTRIEEVVDMGFAAPVGDPTDMFDTFTRIVNERCGGVRGRSIDLRLVEVAALGVGGTDIDTLRNAACIEATEDHEAVVLLNTTSFQGTAQLCITEEHYAALIGHQALPEEYVRRGGGRLITTATTLEANLRALADYLISSGALDGRRVGVVAPNTPGEAEATEGSLVAALEAAGADVRVFDVLDCAGTSICIGGMAESVQRLMEEEVDALFPTLNAVSLPAYITEMVTQGFAPGEVRFYNSDFNSQGNEVVAGLIVTFGGEAAGALYDGTVLLVHGDAGRYRLSEYPAATPFDTMCMREYAENSATGEHYDPRDPAETNKHAMVGLVCSVYRVALRALYDAGPNPSRADIFAALENLGPVDLIGMLPGSLAPGKWTMGDSLQPVTFRYPCPFEGLGTSADICLVPGDYSELRVGVD